MTVKVLFKKNYPDAQLPKQAYPGDSGLDLYSYEDGVYLPPRKIDLYNVSGISGRRMVDCGFSMAIPEGWEAQIRPRSGMATKQGITVVNSPGTIDSGYRGNIFVCLLNLGTEAVTIRKGDRIAQMVISEVPYFYIEEVNELPESERGQKGWGSSGV